MELKDKSQQIDASSLAFSILKRLDAGSVETFEERLRSQKIQYLAQVSGVSPAYTFGLYLRGPYSSKLADDLFKFSKENKAPDITPFVSNELEDRFSKLQKFIKDKSTRELELIATMHWLLKTAKLKASDAVKRIKEWKSVTEPEIEFVMSQLQKV